MNKKTIIFIIFSFILIVVYLYFKTPIIENKDNFKNIDNIKDIWETKKDWILDENKFNDTINELKNNKENNTKKNYITNSTSWSLDINLDNQNLNSNITFDNYNLNSNINNLIKINWDKKNLIKYVNIGWVSLTPIVDKDEIFLSIAKNTFWNWEYFIILQMMDNSIITLNKKISFVFNDSETNIANITPKSIKNTQDTHIVLQWNWFSKVISLQLSNNIILKNASFEIISDQVMSVKIPKNLNKWTYFLNIMTTKWIINLKNNTFIIN